MTGSTSVTESADLVRLDNVSKVFSSRAGEVTAVDAVSFGIARGETVGLVGESGSGKSTVARLLMGLQAPTSGRVLIDGQDIAAIRPKELRLLRRRMQMVFQNPYGSLLPHYTAVGNVSEPLRLHKIFEAKERREEAVRLLDLVGIGSRFVDHYPRQFSGGQQQRIAIARALALKPDVLVCDEPTSSLDVSIQAQILELLAHLRSELSLTCLFISHNLAVVERLADRVAVMNRGELVELADTETLFGDPQQEYTKQLLAAVLPVRK